jgi:hypothetical protein
MGIGDGARKSWIELKAESALRPPNDNHPNQFLPLKSALFSDFSLPVAA